MKTLPNGKILNTQALGDAVRQQRKSQGTTQVEFASLCGVGVRFISDLENGKPTVELGKVIQVLNSLGLELAIQPRGWAHSAFTLEASGGPS
ncbi:MAG: helix-turn-helix transcriptional regulator [Cycloclasticus sp.]|nr:helix-turn-helix transcriptional regulator [Cycloclasticus sp.]